MARPLVPTLLLSLVVLFSCADKPKTDSTDGCEPPDCVMYPEPDAPKVLPLRIGAVRFELYLDSLEGKRVGLVVHPASVVGPNNTHLLDTLRSRGVNVTAIFAPEHGFRGDADAGAHIVDGKDTKTGLPIYSLYGANKQPSKAQLAQVDILLFDLQDVGCRFYTYLSTLNYLMDGCAQAKVPLWVLDRPNPNGKYVAGPILEAEFFSFVGMNPIPILHGMTLGELAQMINGEGWLVSGQNTCTLKVIPMEGYQRDSAYALPISPSPNLPNAVSIARYPSLCLFEPTTVSIGRGTDFPFQVAGLAHEDNQLVSNLPLIFTFTPQSIPGKSSSPKNEGKECQGIDYRKEGPVGFDLEPLVAFYGYASNQSKFFASKDFFFKLCGTKRIYNALVADKSAEEIEAMFTEECAAFRTQRTPYLIYSDN